MSVTTEQIAVTNTAALLGESGSNGIDIVVRNEGTATVFLGPSTVVVGSGFALKVGESMSLSLGPGGATEDLYGIAASGSHAVHVLRTNV